MQSSIIDFQLPRPTPLNPMIETLGWPVLKGFTHLLRLDSLPSHLVPSQGRNLSNGATLYSHALDSRFSPSPLSAPRKSFSRRRPTLNATTLSRQAGTTAVINFLIHRLVFPCHWVPDCPNSSFLPSNWLLLHSDKSSSKATLLFGASSLIESCTFPLDSRT